MKICFKVDANTEIGQGHMMRCLAIAMYAKNNHLFESFFVLANDESEILLREYNFEYLKLGIKYDDYSINAAKKMINAIDDYSVQVVFVDSYHITGKYVEEIQKYYKCVCFYCKQEVITAEMIINYNVNYEQTFNAYDYRGKKCKLLLGSKYIPLREEFAKISYKDYHRPTPKILFLTGGSDPYDMVGRICCMASELQDYMITVIIGKYSKFIGSNQTKKNIVLMPQTNSISKIMEEHDIVVSAGGTTMYELCAIGVPTIIYSLADNQISESKYMDKIGCVKYVGDVREGKMFWGKLLRLMKDLSQDEYERKKMMMNMKSIVDGNGCRRICEEILCLEDK